MLDQRGPLPSAYFRYLLYYTARDANGSLCVGVATLVSGRAVGPYTDALGAPLLRRPDGAIDAHVFVDRGDRRGGRGGGGGGGARAAPSFTPYLLWKDDSNSVGRRTTIYMQRLRPDGLGLVGSPRPLLSNDPHGEGACQEDEARLLGPIGLSRLTGHGCLKPGLEPGWEVRSWA